MAGQSMRLIRRKHDIFNTWDLGGRPYNGGVLNSKGCNREVPLHLSVRAYRDYPKSLLIRTFTSERVIQMVDC